MCLDNHTANFKYDISNRKSYDGIANGWGCGDEWSTIKKESVNTEWVTGVKLLNVFKQKSMMRSRMTISQFVEFG